MPADVAALVAELTARDPLARPGGAPVRSPRRACRLRDVMNSPATLPLEAQPDPLARLVRAGPVRPGTRVRGRTLPGRAAVLGAGGLTGAVVFAVLLAGMLSRAGSRAHTALPPAAPSRTSPAATVQVSAGSLAGQPLSAVRRQLQQLRPDGPGTVAAQRQDPGTVLSAASPAGGASRKRDRHHRRRPTAPRQARVR